MCTEKKDFMPDEATTPEKKNLMLSQHLTNGWSNFNINMIERIESGDETGWEITFISR